MEGCCIDLSIEISPPTVAESTATAPAVPKMLKMTKCVSACSFLPTLLPSHREGGQRVNSIQGNGLRLFSSLLFLLASVPRAFFTEGWCLFHRQHSTAWWCWLWRVHSPGYKTHIFQVIMGYIYIYFFFPS